MKKFFLLNVKTKNKNEVNNELVYDHKELAKIVKELIILGISNEYFEKTFFI